MRRGYSGKAFSVLYFPRYGGVFICSGHNTLVTQRLFRCKISFRFTIIYPIPPLNPITVTTL